MNLKEILSYRHRCIVCNRPLELFTSTLTLPNPNWRRPICQVTDQGLGLHQKHEPRVYFNFDGSFECFDNFVMPAVISFSKECPECTDTEDVDTYTFSDYVGSTRHNTCIYRFNIIEEPEQPNKFSCQIYKEIIRYHDKTHFYHLKTSHLMNESTIFHGRFDQNISQILFVDVPIIDSSKLKTTEQLVNKFNLYSMCS